MFSSQFLRSNLSFAYFWLHGAERHQMSPSPWSELKFFFCHEIWNACISSMQGILIEWFEKKMSSRVVIKMCSLLGKCALVALRGYPSLYKGCQWTSTHLVAQRVDLLFIYLGDIHEVLYYWIEHLYRTGPVLHEHHGRGLTSLTCYSPGEAL